MAGVASSALLLGYFVLYIYHTYIYIRKYTPFMPVAAGACERLR